MYLAILIGLFLLAYGAGQRPQARNAIYWLVLIGLFLFSAFRFRVGCDWSGYYNNFIAGARLDYEAALSGREPAWWVIQVAFNEFGLPYPSVNVLTSALFFVGIHSLAKRQPNRLAFLVLLFPILIINMPMSGIRQGAAIGFLCVSLVAFVDQRPARFILWILAGSTFHSSVLAFLLLTPLATGHYNLWRIVFAILLAIPASYFLAQSDAAQLALDRYVDTGIDAFGAIFRVGLLAITGTFYFFVLRRRWKENYPADFALVSIGAWMMLALLPVVGVSSVVVDRLGYYLVPIQAMMFARIPCLGFHRGGKIIAFLPYVGLLIVFSVWSLNSYHFRTCYEPYQTWLFGSDELRIFGH